MEKPNIVPLTAKLPECRRSRETKYPLSELKCGQQFTMDNDADDKVYASVRAAVARFNRMNADRRLRTVLEAHGTKVTVYRDADANAPALETTNPSEFELVAYLSSLAIGTVTQFQAAYEPRFGQLQDWINRMQAGTAMQYECKVNNGVLTVTRLADRLPFVFSTTK